MRAVQLLEKKSDEIAFKISEDITSGAISPNIIDNLLECVHVADDIVDLYYYISRELNRMAKAYLQVWKINMLTGTRYTKTCWLWRKNPF